MTPSDQPAPNSGTLRDRVKSLRLGDRQAPQTPRLVYLPWLLVVVLLFVSAAFGYRAYRVGNYDPDSSKAEKSTDKGKDGKKSELPTTTPGPSSSNEVVLQSKGYILPISLIQISPRVAGQLISIKKELFEEGKFVEKGTLLASIDPEEFDYDLRQAEATLQIAEKKLDEMTRTQKDEIMVAEKELEEVKNTADQLKLEMERNVRLGRGVVGAEKLEQTQFSYQAMASKQSRLATSLRMLRDVRLAIRIDSAKEEVNQAKAMRNKAKMRREWCDIKAPISGTILTKKAELYNLVNPSAFSSGISASLCEMTDLTELEVDLSIQERDISLVKVNQVCLIMPEAYQSDKDFLAKHPQGYVGYVSRLMPTADRAKGAIPVRVRFKGLKKEAPGKYLRPEMGALVSFKNQIDPDPKKE